jgi:hypothetical protein
MATTARFDVQRREELSAVFNPTRMARVWRELVRQQLRRLEIQDLHDYYDFNFNIEKRVEAIVELVLAGQFRADIPLIYRAEKKLGICRHMMLPSPSDALVFQVIADALHAELQKAQPSKQAFYARDRHSLKLPHDGAPPGYPWFVLWPKFQKQLWGFAKAHPILVTTDLTNYFDSIEFDDLRRVIAGHVPTKEVLLDVLFSLIEDLAWRPDYLPRAGKGLPTIQIEAPRLLAHAMLFEVDTVLHQRTKGSFVRWMDDINFGATSAAEAAKTLGELNDVLKSRGLALNLSKTQLLSAREARAHFMFRENIRLDRLQGRAAKLKSHHAKANFGTRLADELIDHMNASRAGNKNKITKRYFNLLGSLRHPGAASVCASVFRSDAALRPTITRYLTRLPFGQPATATLLRVLEKTMFADDVAKIDVVTQIVGWDVPRTASGRRFLVRVRNVLQDPKSVLDWQCWFLYLARFGQAHEALTAFEASKDVRRREPFIARQAITLLSRSLSLNTKRVRQLWEREISTGRADSASVAVNLLTFADAPFPNKNDRVYKYLFPDKAGVRYPIAKFLLLCVVAASERAKGLGLKRHIVQEHVSDPWMLDALRAIHDPWF